MRRGRRGRAAADGRGRVLPLGAALMARWRSAAEFEADEGATGVDPHKRLALASALVKVAGLSAGADSRPWSRSPFESMPAVSEAYP